MSIAAAAADISESRKEEIIAAYGKQGHLFRAEKLSADDARFFLKWILEEGRRQPGTPDNGFDAQLVQLGHEPTIQKYGKQIKEGWMHAVAIVNGRQPRLIEFYEASLLLEEPAWAIQAGDTTAWRRSTSAAAGMLAQLSESNEVSATVREWANRILAEINENGSDSVRAQRGLENCRRIVRQWWRANYHLIRGRRFQGVKPGAEYSLSLSGNPVSR